MITIFLTRVAKYIDLYAKLALFQTGFDVVFLDKLYLNAAELPTKEILTKNCIPLFMK